MKFRHQKGYVTAPSAFYFGLWALLTLSLLLGGCEDTNLPQQKSPLPNHGDKLAPVSFWVATDVHYLDKNLEDGGQAFQTYVSGGDGKMLPYSDEIAESLVYTAKQQRPKFLILSGDLTNNGERSSHEKLAAKLKRLEAQGTQVYVIPGNHDLFNPWARSFKGTRQVIADSISDSDFTKLYGDFGYSEALSRDQETLSYIVRAAPGLWLLMIDSSQYHHNREYGFPQTDGRIAASTLSWINESVQLAAAEHASIVTVMHHNLLDHTSMPVSGFKLNNSQEALNTLRKNRLNLVLSGHIHMQDIRLEPAVPAEDPQAIPVYDIATSALAVNPHQYGSLSFDPLTGVLDYHTAAVDVEGWARASGSTDPNLLNFRAYAAKSFSQASYRKALDSLKDSPFSTAQRHSMSEVMAKLNLHYFAGTAGSSSKDIQLMPGYKLWESTADGFMSAYIQSMAAEKQPGNVALQMVLSKQ
ncbi:serine/threonine protein phosphatase [Paenibacillus albidus]|uniref:Serine/threonine protein phosphatase n=1 Tax=Paenibacillus albidus TaxID=2041023 RepID=A0A917CD09_9BACL|nr:metallophosphoesterase [Paenibacillus albidus]GGF84901.1 serine/threonine protein phosphatase [Paenibacillus albidus]